MNFSTWAPIIAILVVVGGGWYIAERSAAPAPSGEQGTSTFVPSEAYYSSGAQPSDTTTATASSGDTASASSGTADTTSSNTTSSVSATAHTATLNLHALPLGDGKVSTSPKVGYVYSCQTSFNGGGAEHAGAWIQGSTWDLTQKISVQGSVSWPSATFSTSVSGTQRIFSGNGLPVGSSTGIFPIQSSDPAYQYDRNPNSIKSYTLSTKLSSSPTMAANASCVSLGAIGYALNGVAIYNALDDAGRDAVAHEVQDSCDGHPQQQGQYHYHGPSSCMPHANENNALVGYAIDGFGIFSRYDANGREYTNADLDACHGITSTIEWNGKQVSMYHYVLTEEYPYTIGCYRGTPISGGLQGGGGGGSQAQGGGQGGTPPQAAISACSGRVANSSCSFTGGQGTVSGVCRNTPGGSFACVPN